MKNKLLDITQQKSIILGDMHLGYKSSENDRHLDYQNKMRFFTEQLFPYMKEHNINVIIQTGDFWDNRTNMSLYVMHHVMKDFFDYCKENGIIIITIVGNHDLNYSSNRSIYSLEIFERAYDNLYVVSEKSEIIKFKDNNILFVPWMIDEKDEKDVHTNIMQEELHMVVGHFELQNFSISKTAKAEHGLKQNFFKNIPVISGHFHLEQEQDNIKYVGIPYQDNWSSFNENCGFYVMDNDTLELEFHSNTVSHKHLKVIIFNEEKELEVIGLGYEFKTKINAKTDYSILENHALKIFIEVDNAFNKKVIAKMLEVCYTYRIDIKDVVIKKLDEDGNEIEINSDEEASQVEYNIDESIINNLDSDYQKEVFSKISIQADIDMQEKDED